MYIAQITMILYLIVEAHSAYHYLLYARYNAMVVYTVQCTLPLSLLACAC